MNMSAHSEPALSWQERMNNESPLRKNDHRDPYQRDRARILHSAAFRRLQSKTQVHGTGSNDFHRTRLTHSLEAAQIGSGILAQLEQNQPEFAPILPSFSLIEALCLAHDIGHPPYGHGGEVAINYMMREHGGFEGNAQTFRIVTQLEPYTQHHGMNLSRRTVLGLIKYPALLSQTCAQSLPPAVAHQRQLNATEWSPAKGVFDLDKSIFEWVTAPLSPHDKALFSQMRTTPSNPFEHKKTRYKSLDCSIMELADDIAYGVHDLEDAIVLGMVHKQQWLESAASKLAECGDPWFENNISTISERLFSGEHYQRKDAIGGIVNALLTSARIEPVRGDSQFDSSLLKYNAYLEPSMEKALLVFKQFVLHHVIQVPQVQIVEYKGQQIIMDLFEALSTNPTRLLPDTTKDKWLSCKNEDTQLRVIADYISAMTDGYAQRLHQQLFGTQMTY